MDVLLGGFVIVCLFIAAAACLASLVGGILWLRWRIALVPYFRMSEKMFLWYHREQQKDWCTRCGQRIVFGLFFTGVQLPFFFTVAQTDWMVRSGTLLIAAVLLLRGAWGRWLGGEGRQRRRIVQHSQSAHEAFHDIAPATSARAKELLMDIFTAERVIRLGAYTFVVVAFFGALAWDGGARSVLSINVLP